MRLIDADELKKRILVERGKIPLTCPGASYEFYISKPYQHGNSMRGGIRKALRCMEQCPTVDAKPVVHGRWLETGWDNDTGGFYWVCSECNRMISDRYGLYDYCPYCGAKMDGGADNA